MKVKSSDADKEDSVHANSSESKGDGSLEADFPGVAGADVACFLK